MTLHRKYRPQSWADVAGHADAIACIRRVITAPDYDGGALLLVGPSGTGKSTIGHCIMTELGIEGDSRLHVMEGDRCTELTVQKLHRALAPDMFDARWCGVLVDECHKMTEGAVGAWLNALEYLPPRVVVVFTTTERPPFTAKPNEIDAMVSRCLEIPLELDADTRNALVSRVASIAQREGLGGTDLDACHKYLERCGWNLRKAINQLVRGTLAKLTPTTQSVFDRKALLQGKARND